MAATINVLGSALTTTAGNKTVTATPEVDAVIEYTVNYNNITKNGKPMAGADEFKLDKAILEQSGYLPHMSVLDYGCGWGSFLEVIKDSDYEGVDISPTMIALAKEQFPNNKFSISEVGKVKTSLKDIVVAHSVFTHIPENIIDTALQDIKNNIKPTGFALIDILHISSKTYPLLTSYSHQLWLEILERNGLMGIYITERERKPEIVHKYYKVTL